MAYRISSTCTGEMWANKEPRHEMCGGVKCLCDCHDTQEPPTPVDLMAHLNHPWVQEGRCVYCADCGERLFQGHIPQHTESRAMVLLALQELTDTSIKEWKATRLHKRRMKDAGEIFTREF